MTHNQIYIFGAIITITIVVIITVLIWPLVAGTLGPGWAFFLGLLGVGGVAWLYDKVTDWIISII